MNINLLNGEPSLSSNKLDNKGLSALTADSDVFQTLLDNSVKKQLTPNNTLDGSDSTLVFNTKVNPKLGHLNQQVNDLLPSREERLPGLINKKMHPTKMENFNPQIEIEVPKSIALNQGLDSGIDKKTTAKSDLLDAHRLPPSDKLTQPLLEVETDSDIKQTHNELEHFEHINNKHQHGVSSSLIASAESSPSRLNNQKDKLRSPNVIDANISQAQPNLLLSDTDVVAKSNTKNTKMPAGKIDSDLNTISDRKTLSGSPSRSIPTVMPVKSSEKSIDRVKSANESPDDATISALGNITLIGKNEKQEALPEMIPADNVLKPNSTSTVMPLDVQQLVSNPVELEKVSEESAMTTKTKYADFSGTALTKGDNEISLPSAQSAHNTGKPEPVSMSASTVPTSAEIATAALKTMQADAQKTDMNASMNSLNHAAQSFNIPNAPQAATPTVALPIPMNNPQWQESLSQQIVMFNRQDIQKAEIRLHPEELGSLHIKLEMNDGKMQLQMAAAHAAVRGVLESAIPHLRTSLAEQGIDLQQADISHSSMNDNANQQSFFAQQEKERQMNGRTVLSDDVDEVDTRAKRAIKPTGLSVFA